MGDWSVRQCYHGQRRGASTRICASRLLKCSRSSASEPNRDHRPNWVIVPPPDIPLLDLMGRTGAKACEGRKRVKMKKGAAEHGASGNFGGSHCGSHCGSAMPGESFSSSHFSHRCRSCLVPWLRRAVRGSRFESACADPIEVTASKSFGQFSRLVSRRGGSAGSLSPLAKGGNDS